MSAAPEEYFVKLDWNGELRKVKMPRCNYKDFVQRIASCIEVSPSCLSDMKYIDTDGEAVVLRHEKDLETAFDEFHSTHRFKVQLTQANAKTKDELIKHVLEEFEKYVQDRTQFHFGYPYNLFYDHDEIFQFMKFTINNLGDPFVESNYGVHSRKFELDVLAFFANLWKIPEHEYWGYITSCGTEGNLHGILCGRELHPDGILYGSEDCHYSVFKACRMYRMQYCKVKSTEEGEMDYEDFRRLLLKHRDKHPIVVANIGTTVKGAVDNVDTIIRVMSEVGFKDSEWFIHCDGALYAMMLPFMTEFPQVNFEKPVHSICVSGHKFLGCPMPCGIIICRKWVVKRITQRIEYLNSVDTTIMGSRNGHAPIFLWYSIQKGGVKALENMVRVCHYNARMLYDLLTQKGIKCMLNPQSTTVVLERPPERFVKQWQLACQGSVAHVVVMPNVTVEKISLFVDELVKVRAMQSPQLTMQPAPFPPPNVEDILHPELNRTRMFDPETFEKYDFAEDVEKTTLDITTS